MSKKIITLLGLFWTSLYLPGAYAVEVEGLYRANVPAQTTHKAGTDKQRALSDVLVKVSGNRAVLAHEAIRKALHRPAEFLVQFGYQDQDGQQYLQAMFDVKKVNRLLQQTELAVWGSQRPQVVAWLAIEEQQERTILSDQAYDKQAAIAAVKAVAERRGIPLSLPLMDLDDAIKVNIADVWGQFPEPLAAASQRYQADYILLGRMFEESAGQWALQWQLVGRDGQHHFLLKQKRQTERGEQLTALSNMVEGVADFLGDKYGVITSSHTEKQRLLVDNVQDMTTFVTISRLLEKLSSVASVEVNRVNATQVEFQLILIGSPDDLLRALRLEDRLQPNVLEQGDQIGISQTPPDLDNRKFHFQWQG